MKDAEDGEKATSVKLNGKNEKLEKLKNKNVKSGVGKFFNKIAQGFTKLEISTLKTELAEYKNTISELKQLNSSEQKYSLYTNSTNVPSNVGSEGQGAEGVTFYNKSNNVVEIHLKGEYNAGYMSHELKHAYQFDSKRLSFARNGTSGGDLYDFQDEVEAFARGNLFGTKRSFSSIKADYINLYNEKPTQRSFFDNNGYPTNFANTITNYNAVLMSGGYAPYNYFNGWQTFVLPALQ